MSARNLETAEHHRRSSSETRLSFGSYDPDSFELPEWIDTIGGVGSMVAQDEATRNRNRVLSKTSRRKPRWYVLSPRTKKVLWFGFSELVLLALVAATLLRLESALGDLYRSAATGQLGLSHLTFNVKVLDMALGYRGESRNEYILTYLLQNATAREDTTSAAYARVVDVLETELVSRRIEFSMLTNSTGHILVSGNAVRQEVFLASRRGELFNPNGVMDRVLANSEKVSFQLTTTMILPKASIAQEHPPTFRERPQSYLPTGDYHWVDTDRDVLVRFTFTNVHDRSGTGRFLGVLVSGDVLNGKISVAYDIVNAMDTQAGFCGVYLKGSDNEWAPSSLYFRSYAEKVTSGGFIYDSANVDPTPRKLLSDSLAQGATRTVTHRDDSFIFAATRVPYGSVQDNGTVSREYLSSDNAEAVVVRGIDLEAQTTFNDVLRSTMIAVGVVVFLDLLVFLLALKQLIKPLEDMAYALRNGVRITEKDIDKLHVGPAWAAFILVSALPSIICVLFVIVSNNNAITLAMLGTAEAQVGAGRIAYEVKVDFMTHGFVGVAQQAAIHNALLAPTDPTVIGPATGLLRGELFRRGIEFATLVDMSGKVVVSANENRMGQTFDPEGIVNATARDLERQKWTARLTNEEYAAEGPPLFAAGLAPTTNRSSLHPGMPNNTNSNSSALIRYVTTLVDADADGSPDGILVAGDLVTGKTTIPEIVLSISGVGYEAVYLREENTSWTLAAGVRRYTEEDPVSVDVEFPYHALLNEALAKKKPVSRFGAIEEQNYVFAATPLDFNYRLTSTGDALAVDREVFVVLVHGSPTADGDEIRQEQVVFGILLLLVQISATLISIYIAFDPMRKLLTVLMRFGFAHKHHGCLMLLAGCNVEPARPSPTRNVASATLREMKREMKRSQKSKAAVMEDIRGSSFVRKFSKRDQLKRSSDGTSEGSTETGELSKARSASHSQDTSRDSGPGDV